MTQIDPSSCQIKLYRMSTPEHVCPWGLKAVKLFGSPANMGKLGVKCSDSGILSHSLI